MNDTVFSADKQAGPPTADGAVGSAAARGTSEPPRQTSAMPIDPRYDLYARVRYGAKS